MLVINGVKQKCHRCGSDDLKIINTRENSFLIWCDCCEEETLEDAIKIDDVKEMNIWI